jgi:hypothetical protein
VAGAAVRDALTRGGWAGPLRFEAGGVPYAGVLRLVDVDEDAGVLGAHAQARATRGWAGVAADVSVRPGALHADVRVSGDATDAAGEALVATVRSRLEGAGAPLSPADDPTWRRKLAVRAALAVGIGVAAGLAGAAWDRRRRE